MLKSPERGSTLIVLLVGISIILVLGVIFFVTRVLPNEVNQTSNVTQSQSESQAVTATPSPSIEDDDSEVLVFEIEGENYSYSQDEIVVPVGSKVRIVFTSTNGFHDWKVDEFDVSTQTVSTGRTSTVEFVADTAGEFEYYCSVGDHRANGMVGTLIVQ